MKPNQTKAIVLIVAGFAAIFILMPCLYQILSLLGFWRIEVNLYRVDWFKYIIAIGLIGFGIKLLMSPGQTEDAAENNQTVSANATTTTTSTNNEQINRISKVSLVGGLIGIVAGSPDESLNKRIRLENSKGWQVVQILPDTHVNLLSLIIRVLLLVITLFIFTTANGYYIVLKRRQ
jgi:hypothetical protein